jgi:ribonuclease-3
LDENENAVRYETPQSLAARLGLPFRDWLLLSRALTHRSYINEHPEALEDNERLEFLGDAVLDFIVGAWLYNRYPEMAEGDLTRMRSALVHTEFGRKIQLGNALRLGRGEENGGGRLRSVLICDAFEALIGALFLNAGVQAVNQFLEPLLTEAAEDVLSNHKIEDPKSQFQEWVQAQGFSTPQYVTRNTSGPEHSKYFEVDVVVDDRIFGSGQGPSKQTAAKAAALDALQQLGMAKMPDEGKVNDA